MINFKNLSPNFINYEHKNLRKEDQYKCKEFLKDKGYILFRDKSDTCALKILNLDER